MFNELTTLKTKCRLNTDSSTFLDNNQERN